MRRRSEQSAQATKEAKRKKLLLALVPLVVIVLAIQGPKLLDMVRAEDSEEATAAEAEASAEATPADESTPPSGTETAGTPATPGTITPASGMVFVLSDTDVPPPADEGQLVSFGRFLGKDPFKQLVEVASPEEGEEEEVPAEPAPSDAEVEPAPDDGGVPEPPDIPVDFEVPDTAELTFNGVAEIVVVGGTFPANDPIFELAGIDGETALIGLVTGSFATGTPTVDLEVGETLTLISQPDGVRYQLKLLRVFAGGGGAGLPASP